MMNNKPLYVSTMDAVLKRVDEILESKFGLDKNSSLFHQARHYVIARTIQNLFLISTIAAKDPLLEKIYYAVVRDYVSEDNGFSFNLEQDLGSNHLYYRLSSRDLPIETTIRIEGYNVILGN